jgi:phosphoribosylformylglycinamidine synthase
METGAVPEVNLEEEKALQSLVLTLIKEGILQSCHDISEGGLAATVAECSIKGNQGCLINLNLNHERADGILFSEAPTRVVASLKREDMNRLVKIVVEQSTEMRIIGTVGGSDIVIADYGQEIVRLPVKAATQIYEEAIACHM